MEIGIPRPKNLKPVNFSKHNHVAADTHQALQTRFRSFPLPVEVLNRVVFQAYHATASDLAPLPPWDFLLRPPQIEDGDEDVEKEWLPHRFLGAGAFGRVALWQRKVNGQVADEIAIKDAIREKDSREVAGKDGLSIEAVINAELNAQPNSQYVSLLRNFRFFPDEDKSKTATTGGGLCRYYLNFCPYDSLGTLTDRYQMWDQWLPEAFLWHLLIQLIKGIQTLERSPPRKTLIDINGSDIREPASRMKAFTLHLDLKPANILLDYGNAALSPKPSNDFEVDFPTVCLADFGLSTYTKKEDSYNPKWYKEWGTYGYMPPEQMCASTRWGCDFNEPPIDPNDQYTRAHNIWCVGKILYDTMTYEHDAEFDDRMTLVQEALFNKNGKHILPKNWASQTFWADQATIQAGMAELVREQAGARIESNTAEEASSKTLQPIEEEPPFPLVPETAGGWNVTNWNTSEAGQPEMQNMARRILNREWKKKQNEIKNQAIAETATEKSHKDAEQHDANKEFYTNMAQHWRYSESLTKIVRNMLTPIAKDRPASHQILKDAEAGYKKYLEGLSKPRKQRNKSKKTGEAAAPTKLFYKDVEINQMAAGPARIPPESKTYRNLQAKCDPDWDPLRPPQEKWQEENNATASVTPMFEVTTGGQKLSNVEIMLRPPQVLQSLKRPSKTEVGGKTKRVKLSVHTDKDFQDDEGGDSGDVNMARPDASKKAGVTTRTTKARKKAISSHDGSVQAGQAKVADDTKTGRNRAKEKKNAKGKEKVGSVELDDDPPKPKRTRNKTKALESAKQRDKQPFMGLEQDVEDDGAGEDDDEDDDTFVPHQPTKKKRKKDTKDTKKTKKQQARANRNPTKNQGKKQQETEATQKPAVGSPDVEAPEMGAPDLRKTRAATAAAKAGSP